MNKELALLRDKQESVKQQLPSEGQNINDIQMFGDGGYMFKYRGATKDNSNDIKDYSIEIDKEDADIIATNKKRLPMIRFKLTF